MYELKKNGKVLTGKSIGTGPSSYEKIIYRAAVSQRLRNTGLKRRFAATRLLGLRVRIPSGAWMSVSCCVSSDIGVYVGLITRPDEFYQLR